MEDGITVGIPAYNARKTLERALDSALSQTIRIPYEIVIVDDGSTDTTANIGLSYEIMFPNTVRLIRTPNRGVAAARNTIVREARYRHLTWLDGDDYYKPEKLECQYDELMMTHMRNHSLPGDPYLMVFVPFWLNSESYSFSRYFVDPVKHILTGDFRAYLWASLTATCAYTEVGTFDERLHRSEDTDWLLRYLFAGHRLLSEAGNEPMMHYHFSTQRDGRKVEESFDFMRNTYGRDMRHYGIYDDYVPQRYWQIANFYHSNKNWSEMWRCRALAAKYGPNRYLNTLNKEIENIKDDGHRRAIKKLVDKHLK